MNYSITNIVARSQASPVPLNVIMEMFDRSSTPFRRSSKFPAVFGKLKSGTCTFFATGTVTFNGCKSENQLQALHQEFKEITSDDTTTTPQIVNVVLTFSVDEKVDLVDISKQKDAFYEPELSNSLQLSLDNKVKVLVHCTGKGIVTCPLLMTSWKS